ncbi:MAG: DUF1015 family protein [Saprospiraceae bacterium]|nr:DUF1015 family protein [Saprospiraceae bacterium]
MNIKEIKYAHPDFNSIYDIDGFFETVKNDFPELNKQGIFYEEKNPGIFIYRIKTKLRTHYGILAGVDINEYLKGNIKKHENTLTAQEKKIAGLMYERDAVIKPVLLAYHPVKKIKNLIVENFLGVKPSFHLNFKKDDQIHDLFCIKSKKDIKEFQKAFKRNVKTAYIADGHHRMSSISTILEQGHHLTDKGFKYLFCALFDFDELSIFPYNRFVQLDNLISADVFFEKVLEFGKLKELSDAAKPTKKHQLIFYFAGKYFNFVWDKKMIGASKKLNGVSFDIDLFNKHILGDILHIKDIRSDQRIGYVEGTKSWKTVIKNLPHPEQTLAVQFYPVRKTDFTKIADQHKVLPPKSTWFEPRIRNGILIQELNLPGLNHE